MALHYGGWKAALILVYPPNYSLQVGMIARARRNSRPPRSRMENARQVRHGREAGLPSSLAKENPEGSHCFRSFLRRSYPDQRRPTIKAACNT